MPKSRFDFVVIIAFGRWLLRPVSNAALAFVQEEFPSQKLAICNTLVFDSVERFHTAIESLSNRGLRVEVL